MAGRPSSAATLLPAPVTGWPVVAYIGEESWPEAEVLDALARIRAERLWWPQPQSNADSLPTVTDTAVNLASIDPGGITRFRVTNNQPLDRFAIIAGLMDDDEDAAIFFISSSRWIDPWRGNAISLTDGLAALSFLASAAKRNRGGHQLIGMSPWKRRCLAPFLTGPDGPPGNDGRPVIWGAGKAPDGALRVEDGFLRSVGLGLRHTPPASLTFDTKAPYFDATRRNGFEDTVDEAAFTPELVARSAALRRKILSLRLSKYNVGGATDLPIPPNGREAVLVPGQVETDASIRLGGVDVRTNRDLLIAARAAAPDAFIIYKPHPDVLTGLREGDVVDAAEIADHVETAASAPDCLDWADHVITITSLMGFEALLRGKRVTTLGRPFYSGWGLTNDLAHPGRPRALTLDELTAAALILYPRYVDPISGLPAPVEIVVDALAEELAAQHTLHAKARRLWRNSLSWILNRL